MTDSSLSLPFAPERHAGALRAIHWLTAATIVAALGLALSLESFEDGPLGGTILTLHRSFGALVLGLTLLRLLIRAAVTAPRPGMASWERRAARAAHFGLYGLLLVVPLLGWALTSASGKAVSVFGLVSLPPLLAPNEGLADILEGAHGFAAWTLVALVAVHVLAAVWHQLVRRDGVLRSMLP